MVSTSKHIVFRKHLAEFDANLRSLKPESLLNSAWKALSRTFVLPMTKFVNSIGRSIGRSLEGRCLNDVSRIPR